jgi:hypothetical protein
MTNTYKLLVRKLEGKRPLRRPRRRWDNNIRMDLRETGREVMNWIHVAQDTARLRLLVNTTISLGVP